jgi:hypothetical protein
VTVNHWVPGSSPGRGARQQYQKAPESKDSGAFLCARCPSSLSIPIQSAANDTSYRAPTSVTSAQQMRLAPVASNSTRRKGESQARAEARNRREKKQTMALITFVGGIHCAHYLDVPATSVHHPLPDAWNLIRHLSWHRSQQAGARKLQLTKPGRTPGHFCARLKITGALHIC